MAETDANVQNPNEPKPTPKQGSESEQKLDLDAVNKRLDSLSDQLNSKPTEVDLLKQTIEKQNDLIETLLGKNEELQKKNLELAVHTSAKEPMSTEEILAQHFLGIGKE